MLVNKYKRVASDDEDERADTGGSPNVGITTTEEASSTKQSTAATTPSFVTSKTLSVAPAVPEYKMGVRKITFGPSLRL